MDLGKAFSYIMNDPDYLKKIGLAVLISLIPVIGGVMVLGWSVEITRRVIRGETYPLPEWTDFGHFLVEGLKAFVVTLVYLLPVILLTLCVQLAAIPLLGSSNNDAMVMVVSGLSLVSSCISILLAVGISLMLPAVLGIFADTGEIGAALRFGDVFGLLRANFSAYLMAFVGMFLSGFVASLGIIACFVGIFVTGVVALAINAHLHGQAYLAARRAVAPY